MSLVSNFIGGISSSQFGGAKGLAQSFDLNDTTFSDLLEKQMQVKPKEDENNIFGMLGIPAGFEIEPVDFSEKAIDQTEAVGAKTEVEQSEDSSQSYSPFDLNKDGEVTNSEMMTFFSSLLDSGDEGKEARSEVFDFAKKQAANLYNQYSKSVVTDIKEFVEDLNLG